jgi:hypothetical protein
MSLPWVVDDPPLPASEVFENNVVRDHLIDKASRDSSWGHVVSNEISSFAGRPNEFESYTL